jgi:hypothetical protein
MDLLDLRGFLATIETCLLDHLFSSSEATMKGHQEWKGIRSFIIGREV